MSSSVTDSFRLLLAYGDEQRRCWIVAADRAKAAESRVSDLEEAIASAMTSLATGPAKDGYAYSVLRDAVSSRRTPSGAEPGGLS